MTAGIEVISDHGSLQITEGYDNLSLSASGTLSLVTGIDGAINTISISGNTPMLFFGDNEYHAACIIVGRSNSGQNWTYEIVCHSSTLPSGSAVSVPYRIFDTGAVSSGNFGLQVFDSAGSLKFDSGSKYLRIRGVVQTSSSVTSSPLPSADCVAMIDAPVFFLAPLGGGFSEVIGFGVKVVDSTAYLVSGPVSSPGMIVAPAPDINYPRIVFAGTSGF